MDSVPQFHGDPSQPVTCRQMVYGTGSRKRETITPTLYFSCSTGWPTGTVFLCLLWGTKRDFILSRPLINVAFWTVLGTPSSTDRVFKSNTYTAKLWILQPRRWWVLPNCKLQKLAGRAEKNQGLLIEKLVTFFFVKNTLWIIDYHHGKFEFDRANHCDVKLWRGNTTFFYIPVILIIIRAFLSVNTSFHSSEPLLLHSDDAFRCV